jgi:hypothetical protein
MSDVSSPESAEDLISKANLLEETRRSPSKRTGMVLLDRSRKREPLYPSRGRNQTHGERHLSSFHQNKEAADEAKKERDLINKSVPPSRRCSEELGGQESGETNCDEQRSDHNADTCEGDKGVQPLL